MPPSAPDGRETLGQQISAPWNQWFVPFARGLLSPPPALPLVRSQVRLTADEVAEASACTQRAQVSEMRTAGSGTVLAM